MCARLGRFGGFVLVLGCFFGGVLSFFFFFERTMLQQPTANPKFGIPDIVMRKQTFLHLK